MSNKIKVLVVEDSPVMQLLLGQILNSDPALTVCGSVNSGEQAVAFLNEHKPNVIVMDIHMDGMDGVRDDAQRSWRRIQLPSSFALAAPTPRKLRPPFGH